MNLLAHIRRRPLAFAFLLLGALVVGAAVGGSLIVTKTRRVADDLIAHRGPAPAPGDPTPADSGMAYSDVPLAARDGTRLAGWWVIPADGVRRPDLAVVVMAHASDDRGKASLLALAPALHRAGYILLLFDFRSYGASDGTRTTYGFLEQQDLDAAVRLARERALGAPIAIVGQGMGATTALLVAAQDPGVVCVVADSPFPTWDAAFFAGAGTGSGTSSTSAAGAGRPEGGSPTGVDTRSRSAISEAERPLVRWRLGKAIGFGFATDEAREPSVAAPLAASRPVMAIYGEKDQLVPFHEQIRLVASLGTPNATWGWRAPGAGHLGAYGSAPDEYRARVLEFLDASMVEWGHARGQESGGVTNHD